MGHAADNFLYGLHLPLIFPHVLANLGLQVGTQYSVEAMARLTEPAEFVRSISFIEEIIEEVLQKKLESAAGE